MRSQIFIATLFVLASVSAGIDIDPKICTQYVGEGIFYLCPFLQLDTPFNATNALTEEVTFSILAENVLQCESPYDMIYATSGGIANATCQDIAANGSLSYSLINSSDPNQGVNISYPNVTTTDKLGNINIYNLYVELGCNTELSDASATTFTLNSSFAIINDTTTAYTYVVSGQSQYGCPVVSFTKLIDFIANNQYVFAAVFGIIGLLLLFFGLKLFKVAVFLIATVLGTVITGSLFFQLTHLGQAAWILWAVLGVSVLLGVLLGVLAVKLEKVGFFCVGGALGVTGGLILYNGVISPILKGNAGAAPLYITLVVCALIGGIIAFYIFESVLIIATSLIGSYFIVRVISVFAGHFPNEAYVAEGLQSFDAITYAYLAGIIVLAIIGAVVQFKTKTHKEKEEEAGANGNYAYYRY